MKNGPRLSGPGSEVIAYERRVERKLQGRFCSLREGRNVSRAESDTRASVRDFLETRQTGYVSYIPRGRYENNDG